MKKKKKRVMKPIKQSLYRSMTGLDAYRSLRFSDF
jgi:hypothetical protein